MSKFRDYLDEQMKDPEFKAEFDALEPEFAIIQAMIDARKLRGITQFESVTRKTADLLNIVTGSTLKIEDNSEGGVNMCKAIEEIKNDAVYESNVENIKRMLDSKKLSNAEIAEMLNVSVKLVEEIASGIAS